jgi:phage shock protein A
MTYFSRLTDIVTCNLGELLARCDRPSDALAQIIHEMEEGVSGAKRCVKTAAGNEQRLSAEIQEHGTQIAFWTAKAREELSRNDEAAARHALLRKRELDDLIAALKLQQQAAASTREHLQRTLRALEVRLAEARRRQQDLDAQVDAAGETRQPLAADTAHHTVPEGEAGAGPIDAEVAREIDEELQALRRDLGLPPK